MAPCPRIATFPPAATVVKWISCGPPKAASQVRFLPVAPLVLAALLAGCAGPSGPPSHSSGRDGPGTRPPAELWSVPDAEPRLEALRIGGPNKPYEIFGQSYWPIAGDEPLFERGLASWYGAKFHGQPTANGETYDMYAMTAAHKTMPLPSYARVRNPANGREVVVRVNDRGPFVAGRVIDLSYTAALKLGVLGGVAPVEVERITHESIRTGSWRRTAGTTAVVAAAPATASAEDDPIAEIARRVAAMPVPTETAGAAEPPAAPLRSGAGFWLQLGAFREAAAAESWRQQLLAHAGWLGPALTVLADAAWHRVQAGPYSSRQDAESVALQLRALVRTPAMLVERR